MVQSNGVSEDADSIEKGTSTERVYYYFNQPNGCPERLLDENGKVVWSAMYDAWGKIKQLPPTAKVKGWLINEVDQPLRLQGQYFDGETGLYYNRWRYYCPEVGSFISQDPLGLEAGENIYNYAPNVWGWIDPYGLAHEMIGEVFREGSTIFSKPFTSGGIVGENTFQTQLLTHTERQFFNQVEAIVEPGDVLKMKGQLNPCRPGCQPAIRSFVQDNPVKAIYEASDTGLTYKWQQYSHSKLKGTVLQEVYKNGKLLSRHRYWQTATGKWKRAKCK